MRTKHKWTSSTAMAVAFNALLVPSFAHAQAQTAQAQTAGGGLEEVVVTAERVSANLQTTPVAVSALSASALADRQISNVLQAADQIPGLMITPTTGSSSSARITMRGVGQENGGILFDPAVGVYIDNVYMPRINGQFFDFFDVDRLEVLRGPQGTLYGRNTNGGAIKLITKRPSETWTAAGDIAYGTYEQVDADVYMSGPLVADKLAASVSAVARKRDGWMADPNYPRKVDNKDQQGYRGKFLLTPSDQIEIEVGYAYLKDRGDPGIGSQVQLLGNPPSVNDPLAHPGRNLFTSELSGPFLNKNDQNLLTVNASYTVSPNITFNSITGYGVQRNTGAEPFVETPSGLNIGASSNFHDHFFSEELNSTFKFDRLKGVAGFYYFDETGHQEAGVPYAYSPISFYNRYTKAYAGYAQGTYNIIENLGLTAGVRYTHENANFDQFYPTLLSYTQAAAKTFTKTTPKFGIDWQAMPDLLVYASFTKGFKSGGFNNVAPNTNIGGPPGTIAGPTPYDPETVTSYEAGVKYTTMDRRLRVNLAVFWANYGGLQLPVFFPGTVFTYTSNASSGRVRGIEVEPTWQITDSFQLYGMGSFSDDKYTSAFNCALYNSQIVNCGLGGTAAKLKGVIPVKTLVGAVFTPDIKMTGSLHISGEWAHNSKYFNNVSNTIDLTQTPREDIFNAAIAWDVNEHWRVTLEGKNLTNRQYALESLQLSNPAQPSVTAFPADPRTADIRVSFKW